MSNKNVHHHQIGFVAFPLLTIFLKGYPNPKVGRGCPCLVRLAAKPSDSGCAEGNDNGKHADCIPFIGLPSPPNSLAHVDPLP